VPGRAGGLPAGTPAAGAPSGVRQIGQTLAPSAVTAGPR